MTNENLTLDRFPTGIEGLDIITNGGLLACGVYIVQGLPGSGKTILANQMCYAHIAAGGRAVYVTLLAESHTRMLQHLRPMSFFNESVIPDQLFYVSAFRTLEEEGLKGLLGLLRREIRDQRISLLILDGLVAAEESAPTPRDFKKFIHELQSHAVANGCTVLLLTSGAGAMASAEHTMVDGLIELSDERLDVRNERTLEVRKFRGSASLRGKHSFRITPQGIRLFPRIESWLSEPSVVDRGSGRRVTSGSLTLDQMLHGGVSSSSVTAVVGPTGAGKTLLSLQFLAQSSREEPGLLFSFYESPVRIQAKASAIGHDVTPLLDNGHLQIIWHPQGEHLLDELGHDLLRAVRARRVRRLAIDGLGGLLESVSNRDRIGRFMACLTNELRAQGVATLLTVESAEIVGSAVRMPVAAMSAIVENLIFMRFVERDASLSRLISISKMRNSDYDEHVRELLITSRGLAAGEPLFGFEATFTGVAHATAVRRRTPARRPPGKKR
ncbi:MAG TPA: ATPase domain-containing protein [Steroidobacteraceae bacterium]|nr:ATPase domain-containing protein [Steroidobacteraceae bacterium]